MLRVLANDGYIALKQTAEDTEGWKHREMMSKTCSLSAQRTTDNNNYPMSQKTGHPNLDHNFAKCRLIFKIFSPSDSEVNV